MIAHADRRRRIALVAGGTAGHVYPALAIAQAYQQARPDVDLLFIGSRIGCESRLVPAAGYRFELVHSSPLFGVAWRGKLGALWSVLVGMQQARNLLRAYGADLVIGMGGYASAGTLLAARSLGLRTAIHESNVVPGLTNKFLGGFVDRVYLGFAAAASAFATPRTRIVGNPVRPEVAAAVSARRRAPDLDMGPAHILITGGSQGSRFLNRHAPPLVADLVRRGLRVEVQHQVGGDDRTAVVEAYACAGITASVTSYIDDIAAAYRWADFAIARSGSATISELAVAGLPALLVPLPSAASDHQTANACAFADTGGGWWVREGDWRPEDLATRIAALLRTPEAWNAASEGARTLATPDAAHKLIADCETLVS